MCVCVFIGVKFDGTYSNVLGDYHQYIYFSKEN